MTTFEIENRNRKVAKLVGALDVTLCALKAHPYSSYAATLVAAMGAKEWAAVAKAAGCNAPSETTRAQVIAVYAGRPEHVRQAQEQAEWSCAEARTTDAEAVRVSEQAEVERANAMLEACSAGF
jgi:hypothetical protein